MTRRFAGKTNLGQETIPRNRVWLRKIQEEIRERTPKKQKARLATGLRREKSFWANARMARETLLQSGVYERSANQSRAKTAALGCFQVT
jgi:hypothetical protein